MMNQLPRKSIIALALLGVSSTSFGHGYVSSYQGGVAESRVALCKFPASDTQQKNTHCGSIQYEPQSVEGPDGFPTTGPADGKIASAQSSLAAALDEQTASRWVKRPIQSGTQNFEWTFTANHVTKDWKYYITKPNWNPNQPLARDSFDLNPFCVVEGNMVQPPKLVSHQCQVPAREGYQVILAVWDVGDTAASFYNVIDVQFDGDQPVIPDWQQGGQINPSMPLNVGDSVYTRVFDQSGENPAYRTEFKIETAEQREPNNWSHGLATKINQQQTLMQAGQINSDNGFDPTYGVNPIYLKKGSGLTRVEIGYHIDTPTPDHSFSVTGLEPKYMIGEQPTQLDLTLTAEGELQAELTVFNHHRVPLASHVSKMADGEAKNVQLTLTDSKPGHHMLVIVTKDTDGNVLDQNTQDFHLKEDQTPPDGEYDFVFPNGLETYTEGTKVLASDGHIYQCKVFPYSGYCVQWSESATQFEPATGSHWSSAWDKTN
ncbi:GlcNAc-binding protein A [Vibrio tapetis subsp. tapetis]|uniref:GlcNAc-binding protein A n=3 Tax=Vibrio tapetis TaxID=52443 RepID=A0A2N8Z909_9VIBR|nr:N-acetyl glucosamine binding protein A [Vibrio tapetis]SON48380.1 GlcNAc-binding protein A [Vibrio tapetis subsp. tapetis]